MISVILSFFQTKVLPDGFVYVKDVIPDIEVELRYAGSNNFVGQPVDGYEANKCIITLEAANKLRSLQEELYDYNLCLKIYDAYRPQIAVDHFVRWAKNLDDTINKQKFYPEVNKQDLFLEGYIASQSRHSSGSTVDITLVDGSTGKELDMGSDWDYFGQRSWVDFADISDKQKANRQLLQAFMAKHGFRNYSKEWWHFTLLDEPFVGQYLEFIVQ
ncbi:MAG: peptidase M15 [Flavobacteriaceae bacterium]|nr:M15 family metallopeptidase [Bacteroidia bacterium]NND10998.1 M15 family metallopeptidase [Flavobacteriaceae bacterium]NNL60065.1 M15 family metallopeptidase [Flavobacteriaceae bacterium]RZV62770.1 MAG: peptidase M15 [Flavobacteriaceae bacterium]